MFQDLNIGIALWLAAGGNGRVNQVIGNNTDADNILVKYKSEARILLVGSGADEQCAGYGRHKTKYRQGRYAAIIYQIMLSAILILFFLMQFPFSMFAECFFCLHVCYRC